MDGKQYISDSSGFIRLLQTSEEYTIVNAIATNVILIPVYHNINNIGYIDLLVLSESLSILKNTSVYVYYTLVKK